MIFLRTFCAVAILLFSTSLLLSQTVLFSEDFEPMAGPEYNGATTGTSAEGYTWNTNCPSCVPPDDIFETLNGQLRGADTNGPAFFTVNGIDATGCFLLTFQFDYNSTGYAGSGNLECAQECPFNGPPYCSGDLDDAISSTECNNCWDFLAWEINSGSIADENVVLGIDCNASANGSVESDPLCLDQPGADPSNVNLVITMSMWATDEWMEFDNITILCYTEMEANDASLPIPADCGGSCTIDLNDVTTTEPTCNGGNDGSIEIDATGMGVNGNLEYSIDGGIIFEPSNIFNDLPAGTYDIVVQDDSDASCFSTTTVVIGEPPAVVIGNPSPLNVCYTLFPPGGEILNLDVVLNELTNFDPTLDVNWFFDMVGNDPLDPTDPSDIFTLVSNLQTTIYASVSDGTCESNIVPVSINLSLYPDPNDAMLTECADLNGDATFTPSDADGDITGGASGLTVTYHNTSTDAENGDDPIIGNLTTGSDLTLYASVQNATGCITVAELDLIVNAGVTAEDTTLEVCDDGSGQGLFDLTEAENTILNGQSGTVIFYEDAGLNNEILNPTSYSSGPAIIYAVIDDGMGCISAPAEVTLQLISIDPADVFLSFNPTSGCGNTAIEMTLNTPASPPGDYTFNVSFGPQSTGPVSSGDFIGVDGENLFTIGANETYVFVLNSVIGPGPGFCPIDLPMPIEYIIPIGEAPDAFPASQTACPDISGDGTFNLDLLTEEINGFTGLPVEFFEDPGLTIPITNPQNYISGATTVYAVVDGGGGCASQAVEVELLLAEPPSIVEFTLDQTQSCGPTDVDLTFTLPPGIDYAFNLFITDGSGTSTTFFFNISNGSILTFPVTETTTFEIFVIGDDTNSPFCTFSLTPVPSATITIGGTAATAEDAILEECGDPNGEAVFDLTQAEGTILNGQAGTVIFYEDPGLNNEIINPGAYLSGSSTVYAVIDSGSGCLSAPAEVELLIELAPDPVDFTLDITNSCDPETVTLTFSLPNGNDYSFDLLITDGSGTSISTYNGITNFTQLSFPVTETTAFSIEEIIASSGCVFDLAPIPSASITIGSGFTPNPANLEACDSGNGDAIFDLTDANATVNGNSGNTVLWFTDMNGNNPIGNPNSYTSGNGTVYAAVDNGSCISETVEVILTVFDLSTVSIILDQAISCASANDGEIFVDVIGPMPYTFNWNDNTYDGQQVLTGLDAGFYSLTLTDGNGCQTTTSIDLDAPPALDFICTVINDESSSGANDGEMVFDIIGGTPLYQASLTGPFNTTFNDLPAGSQTIDNLPPGDYTLTITDENGCVATCNFTIEPALCTLDFTLEVEDVICFGEEDGTISIVINDGVPNYTYDWSDDQYDGMDELQDLSPGTYTVTVTDADGCMVTQSATIEQPTLLLLECRANTTGQGNGPNSYTFIYSDGTPSYELDLTGPVDFNFTETDPGFWDGPVLPPGNYIFTLDDGNGCSRSCSFTIAPICDLTLDLTGNAPQCAAAADGTLDLAITSSATVASIDWNIDALDGLSTINGLPAGTYTVIVTDDNNCTETASITLNDPANYVFNCTATNLPSGPDAMDGALAVIITDGPGGPYTVSYDDGAGNSGTITEAPANSFTQNGLAPGIYQISITNAAGCTASCSVDLEVPPCPLTLSQASTAPTCSDAADGTATVTPLDGTPDYTYDWSIDAFDGSATATGLAAGTTLNVTVTDAVGCAGVANFTVSTPPAVIIDCSMITDPGNATATDGSIDLMVSGGAPPYTVSWSGPVNGSNTLSVAGNLLIEDLTIGDYTIIVEDNNGCSASCLASLTAITCDLSLDLQGDNPDCAGAATGSLDLFIDSSFPIVSIDWNVDALDGTEDPQNLAAATYAVTVTDNAGCTAMTELTLIDPPAIFVDCSQTTDPSSPTNTDGSVEVVVAGGNFPYQISWVGPVNGMTTVNTPGSFIITDLNVGIYTITVEDQTGCQEFCGFVMTNNDNCNFNVALSGTDPTCNGETNGTITLQLNDGQADYTFTWNDSSLDSQGPSGNQTNLGAGDYSVTVTDENNCTATGTFTLNEPDAVLFTCTATTQPSSGTATDGIITIDFTSGPSGTYTLTYDNGTGTMGSIPITPGLTNLDNLPVGSYTITIDNGTCSAECMTDLIDSSCTFDLTIAVTPEQCEGAEDGTATAIPEGGAGPYTYAWSNLAATQQITALPPGNYTLTVTDAAGCIAVATTSVLPGQPLPTVTSGLGATICHDSCYLLPLSFTGTAPFELTYALNFGGSSLDFQQSLNTPEDSLLICPATQGIPSGDFTVELTLLTDASCESNLTSSTPFTYLAPATGTFNPTICAEDSVQVGDQFFGFTNPNGEVILPGAATSGCDSTVMVDLDFFAPSTLLVESDLCSEDTLFYGSVAFFSDNLSGVVVLENASSNGCDSTITVNLNLIQGGTNVVEVQLCEGDTFMIAGEIFDQNRPLDTIALPNQAANGCDSLIFVNLEVIPLIATPLEVTICSGGSTTVGDSVLTMAGNYDILLPDASANGCDSLVAVTLEVLPLVATPVELLICAGDSVTAGDSLLTAAGNYDILLPDASTNGCDSLVAVTLGVFPLVATPVELLICAGDSITVGDSLLTAAGNYDILLPDASANGCDSLVAVTLDFFLAAEGVFNGTFCDGEEVLVGDSLFTVNNASGTVLLSGASSNGCDSTVVVDLTFLPEVMADLDTLLCFGESLMLAGQTFDAQNPTGVVVLENAAVNGCDSTLNVTTSYLPELFASIGPDTLICGDQMLDAVVSLSPGANYDFSVQVSTGFLLETEDVMGGEYTFGLGTIDSEITLTLIEVSSSTGCPVTIENDFATIRYSDTQLTLNSTGGTGSADLSCANSQDGSIAAQLTGGVGPFDYEWNTGETTASLDNLGPGTYTLTVTDAPGCSVEETVTFIAPPPLTVLAQGVSAGCFGETTGSVVIDTIFGGTGPYEYSLDNEFFVGLGDFPNVLPDLEAGAYTVYIQDGNDCQASVNIAVPIGEQLDLDLGADQTIQAGDSVLLDPVFLFDADSWVWTPPTGLRNPDTIVTYAAPLETTIYQLEVTDPNGCSASDIVRIIVERNINIYIPNAFSPDGDGSNDEIMIFAGAGVEMIESFQIFDRWGDQVYGKGPFPPNDPNFGWDGKLNGELMNPAVFVYFAQVRMATGEVVTVEGDFVLLR